MISHDTEVVDGVGFAVFSKHSVFTVEHYAGLILKGSFQEEGRLVIRKLIRRRDAKRC